MFLIRILNNAFAIAVEIGLVVAIAWLGYSWPLGFAVLTAVVSLGLGLYLEIARVTFELPFYFRRAGRGRKLAARLLAAGEACLKALVAGLVGLLTFLGTDQSRLLTVAVFFGIITFAGASVLRRLAISFEAVPSRWGYFRLGAPLGVLFSLAISFWPAASLSTIGYEILNLPERPSLEKASEVLFILKQKFDELVVTVLSLVLNADLARIAGAFLSVNVLTGFVLALYAVAVSEIGRMIEDGSPAAGKVSGAPAAPGPKGAAQADRVPPRLR
jgi:hypothetical protein